MLSLALMQQGELSNLYTCTLLWASKLKALQTLQLCVHKINLVFSIATENKNKLAQIQNILQDSLLTFQHQYGIS
jgi:hypothetical protein